LSSRSSSRRPHEIRQRPASAERASRRRSDVGGIGDRRERHPPHAVGIRLGRLTCGVERKPRLPGAAGSGEREQSGVVAREQRPHVPELVLAAEERRR